MASGAAPPTYEERVRQVDRLVEACRAGHLWFRRDDPLPAAELAAGRVRFHEGRIGGAFPELRDAR